MEDAVPSAGGRILISETQFSVPMPLFNFWRVLISRGYRSLTALPISMIEQIQKIKKIIKKTPNPVDLKFYTQINVFSGR